MKLYLNPISPNSRKVAAVVAHLGLDCETQILDLAKGENKTPEFLRINPNGKIPALSDGELSLWESNAIMAYLCDKANSPLWPQGAERYLVMKWMNWELAHFGRWISSYAFETFLRGILGAGEPNQEAMAEAATFIARFARVLDEHLADRDFLVGDSLTIADIAVASHLTYRMPAKLPLAEFENITAWEVRLNEIPAWKASAPTR